MTEVVRTLINFLPVACLLAFIGTTVSLRKVPDDQRQNFLSAGTWIVLSIVGGGLWVAVLGAVTGFGYRHGGGGGILDYLATGFLLVGPLAYIATAIWLVGRAAGSGR